MNKSCWYLADILQVSCKITIVICSQTIVQEVNSDYKYLVRIYGVSCKIVQFLPFLHKLYCKTKSKNLVHPARNVQENGHFASKTLALARFLQDVAKKHNSCEQVSYRKCAGSCKMVLPGMSLCISISSNFHLAYIYAIQYLKHNYLLIQCAYIIKHFASVKDTASTMEGRLIGNVRVISDIKVSCEGSVLGSSCSRFQHIILYIRWRNFKVVVILIFPL